MTRIIDEYIVHCSATQPDWFAGKSINEKRDEIRLWHIRDRGWLEIGYAGLFDRDGSIATGRDLNKDGDFFDDIGAHVLGRNSRSVGGCLIGGFGSESTDLFEDHFTEAQDRALRLHIEEVQDYAKRKLKVTGHNQYANKACPGFYVPDWYARKQQRPLVGFQDKNLMRADYEPTLVLKEAVAPAPKKAPVPVLKWGSKGEAVRALQARLIELRYYPGAVDGDFQERTHAALMEFQLANGLEPDGKYGPQTRAVMATAVPRALREVSVEKLETESRTIKAADEGKEQLKQAAGGAAVVGVLAQIQQVNEVLAESRGMREILTGMTPQVLMLIAFAFAGFMGYKAYKKFTLVKAVRIDDARTGANTRI